MLCGHGLRQYNSANTEDTVKTQRREVLGVLAAAAGSALLPGPFAVAQAPAANQSAKQPEKQTVTGIGGFFFRAHDPKALGQWYQDHLGIFVTPQAINDPVWQQQAGPTVFSAFPEKTGYFGDLTKQWMINFRVSDLDKMAAQLEAAGIAVKVDPTTYPNGRFAHTHDPEGNPIELWQPMNAPPAK
jgi:predicted enzyme related to lactoylglutathione lyase